MIEASPYALIQMGLNHLSDAVLIQLFDPKLTERYTGTAHACFYEAESHQPREIVKIRVNRSGHGA